MAMTNNPLLDFTDLPLFDRIKPEHVSPAVDTLLADAETALQTVTAPEFPADWNAISKVLDVASERFSRAWGAIGHLNAVADTPELRAAYNEAMPRVTAFWTRLGSDERLYAKYKAIDVATLNAEQRQAHRNAVRNFVLGGAELQGEAKKRFADIQERQAELSQKFSENALAKTIRAEVAGRTAALKAKGVNPALSIILVGEDPASQVYTRHKVNDSAQTGLEATLETYPADMSEADLLARIRTLNDDPKVHGILVQLPLPGHMDSQKVIETISPAKDVDGFHVASAGALMIGAPGFWPCTPHGCMKMLESIGYDLRGKHAVVIGRSNIVGKPMAMMLLAKSATVTICHSATQDLGAITRQADVIVAAVGKLNLLTADMVKPGAVVIDVGMNRKEDGKLAGDVDFDGVKEVASWITPVPGGVGPMTRAMLLANTLEAAERAAK